jgi:hypothetical protein
MSLFREALALLEIKMVLDWSRLSNCRFRDACLPEVLNQH